MVFVIAQQSFSVHSTEIIETGILIESLLKVMSCKWWSLVFNLGSNVSILLIICRQIFCLSNSIEQNFLIMSCKRNRHHICSSNIDRKIAFFWLMIVHKNINWHFNTRIRVIDISDAVHDSAFITRVYIKKDAELSIIRKPPFESSHIINKNYIVWVSVYVPSSDTALWLISDVFGWLGLMKLDELRLSEVTLSINRYMIFLLVRCLLRSRPESCRIARWACRKFQHHNIYLSWLQKYCQWTWNRW